MIRRCLLLLLVAGWQFAWPTVAQAADPISDAAITYVRQLAQAWSDNPTIDYGLGFSTREEMDRSTAMAEYPVFTLDESVWGGSPSAGPIFKPTPILRPTSLSWVVVGYGGDPRLVVTVQVQSDGSATAVEGGIVPAKPLVNAMQAADGAGRATFVPQYVSAVVVGEYSSARLSPLLTEVAARNTGLQNGAMIDFRRFMELARAHVKMDMTVPSATPRPIASKATPAPQGPDGFWVLGLGAIVLAGLVAGSMYAYRTVRRRPRRN